MTIKNALKIALVGAVSFNLGLTLNLFRLKYASSEEYNAPHTRQLSTTNTIDQLFITSLGEVKGIYEGTNGINVGSLGYISGSKNLGQRDLDDADVKVFRDLNVTSPPIFKINYRSTLLGLSEISREIHLSSNQNIRSVNSDSPDLPNYDIQFGGPSQ